MSGTTYQLQAADMIRRYGKDEALRMAQQFAAKGDEFWRYVVVCIERTAE